MLKILAAVIVAGAIAISASAHDTCSPPYNAWGHIRQESRCERTIAQIANSNLYQLHPVRAVPDSDLGQDDKHSIRIEGVAANNDRLWLAWFKLKYALHF